MTIIEQVYDPAIKIDKIQEHPENPRRGRDEAVAESVKTNGFFGAILVHKQTGNVLAGNTRLRVQRDAGESTIEGFWVDCDEATAKRILLVDNSVSDKAYYEDTQLLALMQLIKDDSGSLTGTGYDEVSMDLLAAALAANETPEMEAPEQFPIMDPDDIDVQYQCPSCDFQYAEDSSYWGVAANPPED